MYSKSTQKIKNKILNIIQHRSLIIDGAMGTQLQSYNIPSTAWLDENNILQEGCNELLNITATHIVETIHENYAKAGADMLKTNTFGAMNWVLDEYNMGHRAYEFAKAGAIIVKKIAKKYSTLEKPIFVLGSIGPGTKLPSLGHITYDNMYEGYKITAQGLVDGGVDVFLLETCQDPLQIKSAIHALQDIAPQIPIMVSVTIELNGTMLIGTDAKTIAIILEPFDILSLGFNCGTGPTQIKKHLEILSKNSSKYLSIHANAGLPQNKNGHIYYPMKDEEFGSIQAQFLEFDGVAFLGGCCGTTPNHIKALVKASKNIKPKAPNGKHQTSLASLFQSIELKQNTSPLLIGERSNATGSRAFKKLLKDEDFEGILNIAQEQLRNKAQVLDVSVGFAGRDETFDVGKVISLYSKKIPLPLMPDSTQIPALQTALKLIGGKPILNSVNFEDGEERFDKICALAKRFGASLVCLVIDEQGMAKTAKRKIQIAKRIYNRAVNIHKINPKDLVFDMLVFTIGSGDDEYKTAGIETIKAIKKLNILYPEVSTTLGISNISFGLNKDARLILNSVFLYHCVKAGLSSAIVNVKHLIPIKNIKKEDIKICEDLIFNVYDDALFTFIKYFENIKIDIKKENKEFEKLNDEQKVKQLLQNGDKQQLLSLINKLKNTTKPEIIVNQWLIDGMKTIGELFGNGQMQLPFVLQSAECMKVCVDFLKPYLPKTNKQNKTILVLGTVKGDVHDVGKNLVDIILSNNGFKVINIGIKAGINDFIKAIKQYNADAIGMSGLLVKSTNEMKMNLIELKKQGIDIPVLLGGAALTKTFVDEFCRPVYDGAIFYCRDAFDGVVSMQKIEKGEVLDTNLNVNLTKTNTSIKKEKVKFNKNIHKPILLENILINAAKKVVIMADDSKFVTNFNRDVPVEVHHLARNTVAKHISKIGGRSRIRTLDRGYPFITENGNIILDCNFGVIKKPKLLQEKIKKISGVLEVGIFTRKPDIIYKARSTGKFDVIK